VPIGIKTAGIRIPELEKKIDEISSSTDKKLKSESFSRQTTESEVGDIATRAYQRSLFIDCQEQHLGVNASESITLTQPASFINTIFAFTSNGSPATKMLLEKDVDYSHVINSKTLTLLVNQLSNKLVINFRKSK